MTCHIQYTATDSPHAHIIRKGSEPRKPSTWRAKAWFVLASGEKHTHSTTVQRQTVHSLIPIMGALIDSLIADVGAEVTSAGWEASTH